MVFSRILLKLSGEALMGDRGYGIDPAVVRDVAREIAEVKELGTEIAIVIGGGNIYRGMRAEEQGVDRVTGDYMGMLATLLNSLTLQSILGSVGVDAKVLSAIQMEKIAEPFVAGRAIEYLEKGTVLLFACGTGNPFFTTDTAAALRALEVKADVLFKATKVDGVYDKDPVRFSDARFFARVSYDEVLVRRLEVMDGTAITLCRDAGLPVVVFNMRKPGNLKNAVLGEPVGTTVRREM